MAKGWGGGGGGGGARAPTVPTPMMATNIPPCSDEAQVLHSIFVIFFILEDVLRDQHYLERRHGERESGNHCMRMRQSYQQNMVSEIRPQALLGEGTYLAYHVLLVGLAHAHAVVTRLSFPLPLERLGTRLHYSCYDNIIIESDIDVTTNFLLHLRTDSEKTSTA